MPVISIIISKYLYHPTTKDKNKNNNKKNDKKTYSMTTKRKKEKILIMSMYLKTYQSDDMIYC